MADQKATLTKIRSENREIMRLIGLGDLNKKFIK